jgi:hypothetical protein
VQFTSSIYYECCLLLKFNFFLNCTHHAGALHRGNRREVSTCFRTHHDFEPVTLSFVFPNQICVSTPGGEARASLPVGVADVIIADIIREI